MEKLYYSIGEVAGILGENVSLVRFWSDSFPKLFRPVRNAKGNRLYTRDDVETFRQIHLLVRECGMTLEGAYRKMLSEKGKVAKAERLVRMMKSLRSDLEDVRTAIGQAGRPDNA